jgi:hypothetical protein
MEQEIPFSSAGLLRIEGGSGLPDQRRRQHYATYALTSIFLAMAASAFGTATVRTPF